MAKRPKMKLSETRTETEEARWFAENQERLLKMFEQAEKAGALRASGNGFGITISKKLAGLPKLPSGEGLQACGVVKVLRGTADTRMGTDQILTLTRGRERATSRRRK